MAVPSDFDRSSTPSMQPLCTTPLWNRPSAAGVCISVQTFMPPPDWPNSVTLSGSPPKPAMLSWIHCSAATISALPALPEFAYFSPNGERSR